MNIIFCGISNNYRETSDQNHLMGFGNNLKKTAMKFVERNKNVTGQEAQIMLEYLGYELKIKSSGTSHRIFAKKGEALITLTQRRMQSEMINNQSSQIRKVIEKAGGLSIFA